MLNPQSESVAGTISVHDPNLPFLAARAAVELDNLLIGRTTSLCAVHLLAARLRNSTEKVKDSGSDFRTLMDPSTLTVISDAVSAGRTDKLQTLGELVDEASRVAAELIGINMDHHQGQQQLQRARLFCVVLSQLVLKQANSEAVLAYFAAVARRGVSAAPSLGGWPRRVSDIVIDRNFPRLGVIAIPAHPDAGFSVFSC